MREKLQAVVLGTVRHSDRVNVVNLYTDTRGRLAVMSTPPGQSKAGRMRAAALMPLSIISTEINFRQTSELQRLGAVTPVRANSGNCGNPAKSAVALFLCEFLTRLLRESAPDAELWRFLTLSIAELDRTPWPAHFYLPFLAGLTRFTGIEPDVTDYTPGSYFDMRQGCYVPFHPAHNDVLTPTPARVLRSGRVVETPGAAYAPRLLMRLRYDTAARLKLSLAVRRELLDGLLRYYAIHLPGADRLNSLDVLRSL